MIIKSALRNGITIAIMSVNHITQQHWMHSVTGATPPQMDC